MVARTVSAVCLIGTATALLTAGLQERPAADLFPKIVLGASLFKAAWAYKYDRAWLESELEFLALHGFDAIRVLGVVGDPTKSDYWDGREIDWRWPDYGQTIAGVTDLAYDQFGLRVQWTIFADAQETIPREEDRARLVERFIAMSRGREEKILAFEVANEFFKNGFEGATGLRQLGRFAKRLNEATPVPVAISAHRRELCGLYAQGVADFASMHFDHELPYAAWAAVDRPWPEARRRPPFAPCPSLPAIASNNEPRGPGSSVVSRSDPVQLVLSAVNTWLAGLPVYIFHSGPGVRDDPRHETRLRPKHFDELPGAEKLFAGLAEARAYVPEDLPGWRSIGAADAEYPFDVIGRRAVALGAARDGRFIVAISDLHVESRFTARRRMDVVVLDPLTGEPAQEKSLEKGDSLFVKGAAAVITGREAHAQR